MLNSAQINNFIVKAYARKSFWSCNGRIQHFAFHALDALLQLGWRKDVFVVDDTFIGNHKAALELAQELERWQRRNRYPFAFFTEASIDLASRPALLDAMVKANFCRVFIGIESPSAESLKETKKFQNLRRDLLDSIRFIQQHGLWVMGGFIVGFDTEKGTVRAQRDCVAQDIMSDLS